MIREAAEGQMCERHDEELRHMFSLLRIECRDTLAQTCESGSEGLSPVSRTVS